MHGASENYQLFPDPDPCPRSAAVPHPIPSDWHHFYGARLGVFPRCIPFASKSSSQAGRCELCYWPDLATLIEDCLTCRLMYSPSGGGAYSVAVVFHKEAACWETAKYRDADLICHSAGVSFDEAMQHALAFGLEWDEVAEPVS